MKQLVVSVLECYLVWFAAHQHHFSERQPKIAACCNTVGHTRLIRILNRIWRIGYSYRIICRKIYLNKNYSFMLLIAVPLLSLEIYSRQEQYHILDIFMMLFSRGVYHRTIAPSHQPNSALLPPPLILFLSLSFGLENFYPPYNHIR